LSTAGVGLSLAGCLGGDGGDGSDGGDGGDGSDGGDGAVTTTAGGEELQELSITSPAATWTAAVANYLMDENILDDLLESAGYTYEMEITYGGPPLFASGQSDIAGLGATEASIMATNREFNVVIPGQTYVANGTIVVRDGSPFDPDEAGGLQQAFENLANDGVFGIGGWEGGDVKIFSVLFPEAFGLEFGEDTGDFTVRSTGDYGTLPQLVADGELDSGDVIMSLNTFEFFLSDPPELTALKYVPDLMVENGFNPDSFGGIVARKEFADQNEDALTAYVEAWQEGVDWFYDDPSQAVNRYQDIFPGIDTDRELEFIVDFATGQTEHAKTPVFYDPVSLTDEWISQQERFLNLAAERGQVPSGWEDWVEFWS
jgi:ABC-type nitrate/sulfonate/bicarbonate transport system substrate-binding protein